MGKRKSLNFQIHEKMESMKGFGESKHAAKLQNGGQSDKIHSYNTYKGYKQTMIEFCNYLKAEGRKYKTMNEIPRSEFSDYLRRREGLDLSAWTISKDMAAFNKVFGLGLTKKEVGLKERRYKDIKRSRRPVKHDKEINLKNYADAVIISKSTGMRRQSVEKITYNDFVFRRGLPYYVHLTEKGGRPRLAVVLPEYRKALADVLERSGRSGPIVDKYPHRIDNHAYRGEYARKLYAYFISKKKDVKEDYKGYDKKAVLCVSRSLGHNRPGVVFYNYFR